MSKEEFNKVINILIQDPEFKELWLRSKRRTNERTYNTN